MNWIQRQLKKVDNFMVGDIAVANNHQSELDELSGKCNVALADLRYYKDLLKEKNLYIESLITEHKQFEKLAKDYRDLDSRYDTAFEVRRDCKTLLLEKIYLIDTLNQNHKNIEEILELKTHELVDLRAKYIKMESRYNSTVGAMGSERTASGMALAEKDKEIDRLKEFTGITKVTRLASDVEWERAYNELEKKLVDAEALNNNLSDEIVKLDNELRACKLDKEFDNELKRPVDLVTKSATI